MQPTLQTGIFRFLYNTWAHNADALAYFMGIGITFLLLFHKPRRSLVLILIGFIFNIRNKCNTFQDAPTNNQSD